MLVTITCPNCNSDGRISLCEPDYEGPYKCWKCRKLYRVTIENDKLTECNDLSDEEFEKERQLLKLKNKFKKDSD